MKTDEKYIIETFIEADVTSADGTKTCHASMGGVNGVSFVDESPTPLEAAIQSFQAHERLRWLELFLKDNPHWEDDLIRGARAVCHVRSKVHIRMAQGKRAVGEFEFDAEYLADKFDLP